MGGNEPVLLIMAAGMGSRYGGVKQIDPVGQHGEIIIDYSLYDAVQAGFKKAVFIIKEEHLNDFRSRLDAGAGKWIDISYVFQSVDRLPEGLVAPAGREKPWGTGHAVMMAANEIDAPFVVINADDFYGREAFSRMYAFLKQARDTDRYQYSMVGFLLKNTVTTHGSVSRGVCEVKNGYLCDINERLRIEMRDGGIAFTEDDGSSWTALNCETPVSMNFWGFTPSFFQELTQRFHTFYQTRKEADPLKAEYFLPAVVDELVQEGKATVQVLPSRDKWYGVTYQADKEMVVQAIAALTATGRYPEQLWESQ